MTSLSDLFLVGLAVQQLLELPGVLGPDLDHPARAIRVAVHERGIAFERLVYLGHGPREGCVQLRDGLHRLDRAERVATIEAVKAVSELYAPLAGTVTERSEEHTSELQ